MNLLRDVVIKALKDNLKDGFWLNRPVEQTIEMSIVIGAILEITRGKEQ